MEFSGRYHIAAQPQQVWDSLNDPDIVKACLPGCEQFIRVGPNNFQGSATIRTGFMKARFHGDLAQTEATAPWRCVLTGEAQGGAAGSVKGEAEVILEDESGGTVLNYRSMMRIEGKLAQMGHRTVHGMLKPISDAFFQRLDALLAEEKQTAQKEQAAQSLTSTAFQGASSREPAPPEIWVVGLIGVVVILLVLFGLTL